MGDPGPVVIFVGVLWAGLTWTFAAPLAAALNLTLALAVLLWRAPAGEVPWRGLLTVFALGVVAQLLTPGTPEARLGAGLSMGLRLAAMLAQGQVVYRIAGPGGVARALGRVGRPLRVVGVRPQDLEIMALVTIRMIPETARSARSVFLGRRYLGRRVGRLEWSTLAAAWIAQAMRTAAAIAQAMVMRGLGAAPPKGRLDYRGLRLLWLPALTVAFGLLGTVR